MTNDSYPTWRQARIVLLGQSTLPILLSLLTVAIVFTISPQTLDHSPVSFETRGVIHHGFHYALLIGCVFAVAGALTTDKRGLMVELFGLILVEGALAMNLIAIVTAPEPIRGVGLALRVGAMLQLAVRIWILVVRPTASISVARTDA